MGSSFPSSDNDPEAFASSSFLSWGTWEELLLASAVRKHGVGDWDVVSSELQSRSVALNVCPSLFSPEACKSKFYALDSRYASYKSNNGCDCVGNDIPWFEDLRKLRVAQLKRELERSDDSIGLLRRKLKRLKFERTQRILASKSFGKGSASEDSDRSLKNGTKGLENAKQAVVTPEKDSEKLDGEISSSCVRRQASAVKVFDEGTISEANKIEEPSSALEPPEGFEQNDCKEADVEETNSTGRVKRVKLDSRGEPVSEIAMTQSNEKEPAPLAAEPFTEIAGSCIINADNYASCGLRDGLVEDCLQDNEGYIPSEAGAIPDADGTGTDILTAEAGHVHRNDLHALEQEPRIVPSTASSCALGGNVESIICSSSADGDEDVALENTLATTGPSSDNCLEGDVPLESDGQAPTIVEDLAAFRNADFSTGVLSKCISDSVVGIETVAAIKNLEVHMSDISSSAKVKAEQMAAVTDSKVEPSETALLSEGVQVVSSSVNSMNHLKLAYGSVQDMASASTPEETLANALEVVNEAEAKTLPFSIHASLTRALPHLVVEDGQQQFTQVVMNPAIAKSEGNHNTEFFTGTSTYLQSTVIVDGSDSRCSLLQEVAKLEVADSAEEQASVEDACSRERLKTAPLNLESTEVSSEILIPGNETDEKPMVDTFMVQKVALTSPESSALVQSPGLPPLAFTNSSGVNTSMQSNKVEEPIFASKDVLPNLHSWKQVDGYELENTESVCLDSVEGEVETQHALHNEQRELDVITPQGDELLVRSPSENNQVEQITFSRKQVDTDIREKEHDNVESHDLETRPTASNTNLDVMVHGSELSPKGHRQDENVKEDASLFHSRAGLVNNESLGTTLAEDIPLRQQKLEQATEGKFSRMEVNETDPQCAGDECPTSKEARAQRTVRLKVNRSARGKGSIRSQENITLENKFPEKTKGERQGGHVSDVIITRRTRLKQLDKNTNVGKIEDVDNSNKALKNCESKPLNSTDDDSGILREVSKMSDEDFEEGLQEMRDYTDSQHEKSEVVSGADGMDETSPMSIRHRRESKVPGRLLPLLQCLRQLCAHKFAPLFKQKQESQINSRYDLLIRRHVDLGIVRLRLEEGAYSSSSEFFRDLLLIFNNALVFYSRDSQEFGAALALRECVMKEMGKIFQSEALLKNAGPATRKREPRKLLEVLKSNPAALESEGRKGTLRSSSVENTMIECDLDHESATRLGNLSSAVLSSSKDTDAGDAKEKEKDMERHKIGSNLSKISRQGKLRGGDAKLNKLSESQRPKDPIQRNSRNLEDTGAMTAAKNDVHGNLEVKKGSQIPPKSKEKVSRKEPDNKSCKTPPLRQAMTSHDTTRKNAGGRTRNSTVQQMTRGNHGSVFPQKRMKI